MPTSPPISVVKVHCSKRNVSYIELWKKNAVFDVTGTASMITIGKENREFIITNEHVIRGYTAIHITVRGYARQFPATVIYDNPTCDLALLKIKEDYEDEFKKLVLFQPLNLEFPTNGKKLYTQGFPQGGQGFCTTEGTVSRIDSATYKARAISLLRIQISAAINPGSSGGLAIDESNKVLGITSSGILTAQNIGYIIPSEVINSFVTQFLRIERNPYRKSITFPTLNIEAQLLRQKSMRLQYGLKTTNGEETGVLITDIPELSIANKHLKVGDVLLSLDSHEIKADGKINFLNDSEIDIGAFVARKKLGDVLNLKIWRKNESNKWEEIETSITLSEQYSDLFLMDSKPNAQIPYYVHTDGAVFVVPDIYFVYSYDDRGNPAGRPSSLNHNLDTCKNAEQRQLVYLHSVIKTAQTLGAEGYRGLVSHINDEEINTLTQLAEILEKATEDVVVTLERNFKFILSPNNKEKENSLVETHGITSRMSSSVKNYLDLPNTQVEKQTNTVKKINQLRSASGDTEEPFKEDALKHLKPVSSKSYKDLPNLSLFNTDKMFKEINQLRSASRDDVEPFTEDALKHLKRVPSNSKFYRDLPNLSLFKSDKEEPSTLSAETESTAARKISLV